ncbi:uncharacterized protein LOC125659168 [Ostrea edulis]|uniref:uncharacterized protein LOC125659168 n=1 Tax=Ostrea edulis TaxID=37623 RepID=UPI002094B8ED|nr:uncharacterized protein LOC125659168 [Ostrea edulis]
MNHSGLFAVAFCFIATICITLAQLECARYALCVDSMFKKPNVIETRFNNSFIDSVKLLERYSYYRCDPAEEKYSIGANSKEWWVFRGCGGVFEVKECAEDANVALQQKPKEMIKNHHREIDRKCRQDLGLVKPEKVSESF